MKRTDSAGLRRYRMSGAPLAWALLMVAGLPFAQATFAAAGALTTGEAVLAEDTAVVPQGSAASGDAALAAATPTTALERIRATGTIRLGYADAVRPFSYRDDSGNAAGYAVALCERVADAVKSELGLPALELEWVAQSFDQRLSDLQAGRVDVQCAAGVVTLTERGKVSFSIPVFPGSVGALLRRDASSRLTELLEEGEPRFRPFWRASPTQILGEQTFTAMPGTPAERFLQERAATLRLTSEVVPVSDFEAGVQSVLDRKAQVFFADRAMLLDAQQNHPAARDLVVLDREFTYQPIALGVARGDEDMRLLVDRAISEMYRSGELQKVYEAAFGEADKATLNFFRVNALPE